MAALVYNTMKRLGNDLRAMRLTL